MPIEPTQMKISASVKTRTELLRSAATIEAMQQMVVKAILEEDHVKTAAILIQMEKLMTCLLVDVAWKVITHQVIQSVAKVYEPSN